MAISLFSSSVLVIVALAAVCEAGSSKHERALIDHILEKCGHVNGPLGRPLKKASKAIDVQVKFFLNQIFVESDNSLSVNAYVFQKWRDEFISWDPENFGGKDVVSIPASKLWHPDLYPISDNYNNFDNHRRFYDVQDIWVYANGTLAWVPILTTRATCELKRDYKVKRNCTFKLSSVAHDVNELNLKFLDGLEDFELSQYVKVPGVKLVAHSAERVIQIFNQPIDGSQFWSLNYNVVVKIGGGDRSHSSSSADKRKKPVKRQAKRQQSDSSN